MERLWTWLAWHLPRDLVYWCSIRVFAHATTGDWSRSVVPETTILEAMARWQGHYDRELKRLGAEGL